MHAALNDVLLGKLVLLPLAVAGVGFISGHAAEGVITGGALAGASWVWAAWRGRDPTGFATACAALVALLVSWALPWPLARHAGAAVLEGLLATAMAAGVALDRPWTMSIAGTIRSRDLPPGALLLRIHRAISALWALAFALLASSAALAWPAGVSWAIVGVSASVTAVLPAAWARRVISRRLARQNAWMPPAFGNALMDRDGAGDASVEVVDVVVIGAGLGGLTAAALLARNGLRVVACEQHRVPGGFAHDWIRVAPGEPGRPVFRFDGGVHDVSGTWPGGAVRGVLEHLGIAGDITWLPMRQGVVNSKRGRVDVADDWSAYIDALCQEFPREAPGIRSALADIHAIFDAMYSLGAATHGVPVVPSSTRALMDFGRRHALAAAWLDQPFDTFLRQRVTDARARAAITRLAGYVTDRPEALTVAAMVPLFGYQIHGGAYPAGGSGRLAQVLAQCIERHGGTVRLRTRVERVLVEGGRAAGVVLADGRSLRARAVVMNADLLAAAKSLLPDTALPPAFVAQLDATRAACSAFSVHLGLRGAWPDTLPPLLHVDGAHGRVFLSLTSRADPTSAPKGYSTLEIIRLVPNDEARTWFPPGGMALAQWRRSDAYARRKHAVGEALIDAAEEALPGLRARIVLRSDASPVTYQRYDLSTDGSIYGCDGAARGRDPRGPVPGLVFAGAVTHGPGVEAVMISGALAADALRPGILGTGAQAPVPDSRQAAGRRISAASPA